MNTQIKKVSLLIIDFMALKLKMPKMLEHIQGRAVLWGARMGSVINAKTLVEADLTKHYDNTLIL